MHSPISPKNVKSRIPILLHFPQNPPTRFPPWTIFGKVFRVPHLPRSFTQAEPGYASPPLPSGGPASTDKSALMGRIRS